MLPAAKLYHKIWSICKASKHASTFLLLYVSLPKPPNELSREQNLIEMPLVEKQNMPRLDHQNGSR